MAYKKIHQIRIDFNVTEKTRRYVFVYIIEAGNCYMIDSGVYGSEKQISSYMERIGRKLSDIKKNISDPCTSGSYRFCGMVQGESGLCNIRGTGRAKMDRRYRSSVFGKTNSELLYFGRQIDEGRSCIA